CHKRIPLAHLAAELEPEVLADVGERIERRVVVILGRDPCQGVVLRSVAPDVLVLKLRPGFGKASFGREMLTFSVRSADKDIAHGVPRKMRHLLSAHYQDDACITR